MPVSLVGLMLFILPHVKSCSVCLMPAGGGSWQGGQARSQARGQAGAAALHPEARRCSDSGGVVLWEERVSVAL